MENDIMGPKDVLDAIPSVEELQDSFAWLRDYWSLRNDYIAETREAHEGRNEIPFPVSEQYKSQVIHLGLFTSMVNEKVARYLHTPTYQVIIEDPTDPKEVEKSSRLEHALNVASYETERLGDGDVWGRTILDAHLYDTGVYKMQLAPAPLWRELVDDEKTGSKRYPKQSKERDQYKKEKGIPIRRTYTPLENFLPQYDGSTLDHSWELEPRLLSSCLKNPLFDKSVLEGFELGSKANTMQVPLLHYCDDEFFATFAAQPRLYSPGDPANVQDVAFSGMQFLYGYKHGLGRSIYNVIAGRYGGWKTNSNRIESVTKLTLGLNEKADMIASQVLTNIRAKYWPTMQFAVDPELRGINQGGKLPDAPQIPEGSTIVTFKGEELKPLFLPGDDPTVPWTMDLIKDQLGKLGGSNALFGQAQPGVETGYHNAQQVSQAEHLDEKTEQHIVQGAIQDGTMLMLYIRKLNEKVFMHYREPGMKRGKVIGKYVSIDPKDLYPLPRLDARVRKPRPIDFVAQVRAARELSDDRQGKGALMPDINIRGEILSRESPEEEELLVRIQEQKNKLWNSGVIDQQIQIAMNLKMATNGVPPMDAQTAASADPSLVQAAQAQTQNPNAQAAGGISPEAADNLNIASGGVTPTDSQPEARVGEAAAVAAGGSL